MLERPHVFCSLSRKIYQILDKKLEIKKGFWRFLRKFNYVGYSFERFTIE